MCTITVVRRKDAATVVEVQAVRMVVARRHRKAVATVANIVENAVGVVAITRIRIPDSASVAKSAREVHSLISGVI